MPRVLIDTIKLLKENLAIVKETVSQLQSSSEADIKVPQTCQAIEVLTDLCEEIDYANDFSKLDGFMIFIPLIRCSHETLIIKACELIAALCQNNPTCQDSAVQIRLLDKLIEFVDLKNSRNFIQARSYALYAISSIIRLHPGARTQFERQLDGLTVLLRLLDFNSYEDPSCEVVSSTTSSSSTRGRGDSLADRQAANRSPTYSATPNEAPTDPSKLTYWLRKLRIRAIFLFRNLCSESQYSSELFYERQAIKLLAKQLQQPQDRELREHLLQALHAYLESQDHSKRLKSMEVVPNIRDIVASIRRRTSVTEAVEGGDFYDLTDTRSICEDLLALIDSIKNNTYQQDQSLSSSTSDRDHQNEPDRDSRNNQADSKPLQLTL